MYIAAEVRILGLRMSGYTYNEVDAVHSYDPLPKDACET